MRLAVWPIAPARALGEALRGAGLVTDVGPVAPYEAAAALREGRVDLALVPTLEVLRDPDAFALVPGVGLVGDQDLLARLVVVSGRVLDAVETVAFDPRLGQAALLAQILLREHYGARPAFVPVEPSRALDAVLAEHPAALVSASVSAEDYVTLDLGQEWSELTEVSMVWALLAARPGTLSVETTRRLRDAAQALPRLQVGETEHERFFYEFTLDQYAHESLDAFVHHLYYHGNLADLPALPFLPVPEAPEAQEDE